MNMSARTVFALAVSTLLAANAGTTMSSAQQQRGAAHSVRSGVRASQRQKMLIARGKAIFTANQCLDCHRLGGRGCVEGVELDGVGSLRSTAFLTAQLADPEKHVRETLHSDANMMTAPNLSKDEVRAVVAYLKTLTNVKANARPDTRKSQ